MKGVMIRFERGGWEYEVVHELLTIHKVFIKDCGLAIPHKFCTNWTETEPPQVVEATIPEWMYLGKGKFVERLN